MTGKKNDLYTETVDKSFFFALPLIKGAFWKGQALAQPGAAETTGTAFCLSGKLLYKTESYLYDRHEHQLGNPFSRVHGIGLRTGVG